MVKEVSIFQPDWVPAEPGQRPPLNDERLSVEEAARVGAYLEAGAVVMHTTVRGVDVLQGDAAVIPLTVRTDGEYIWTGPVTYYVQTYAIAPDAEFLAYLRARDFEQRVPEQAEIRAAEQAFMEMD